MQDQVQPSLATILEHLTSLSLHAESELRYHLPR
jgi:hypothetical protein